MPRIYTQEEVSKLLLDESLNRVIREAQNLKDDAYTKGFGEGYLAGKQELIDKQNEENATKLDSKDTISDSNPRTDNNSRPNW